MNRKDIALQLSSRMKELTLAQATEVMNHVVDIMTHSLAEGEPIYLRGFATIETVERKAHKGYNFNTGSFIEIPARTTLRIVVANRLKQVLNRKNK